MKRAMMLILFAALLSPAVSATDLPATIAHTITAADTTAQKYADTVYSSWVYLPDVGNTFWFTTQINHGSGGDDTALATDTFWVYLQHSSTRQGATGLDATWDRTNLLIDTIRMTSADNDTLLKHTTKLRCDSTWTGDWARAMFIYRTTTTIGRTSSIAVGDVRTYYMKLWINGFKK